jgi:hypothetical protein
MNELDDRIFYYEDVPTTTNTTTKRIFNPTPPPPPPDKKRFAILEFFRIMHIGMRDVEMLPSDMRKYESWTLNIKSGTIAFLICSILMYTVISSSLGSQPYNPNESNKRTYIDDLIDYFIKDEMVVNPPAKANTVVVVKDTLVPMDSLQYLIYQNDSLIKAMNR